MPLTSADERILLFICSKCKNVLVDISKTNSVVRISEWGNDLSGYQINKDRETENWRIVKKLLIIQ